MQPRRGLDALLDSIETLQGAALPASLLETEILPARISGYQSADLDKLIAAGEVVWVGLDSLGDRDGRIGLYLADKLPLLWPPEPSVVQADLDERSKSIIDYLRRNGASFFHPLHEAAGGGYPGDTLNALWSLVWRGFLINDAFHALRAYCERTSVPTLKSKSARQSPMQGAFRSRRTIPPAGQGRWSLNDSARQDAPATAGRQTEWSHATALQLLARYGIVSRETARFEALPGGFFAIYDVLKAFEESGRVRRGYFVTKLGGSQFALPAAVHSLRSLAKIESLDAEEVVILSSSRPGESIRCADTMAFCFERWRVTEPHCGGPGDTHRRTSEGLH